MDRIMRTTFIFFTRQQAKSRMAIYLTENPHGLTVVPDTALAFDTSCIF